MERYISVLKQYWGYDQFRALQGDIIQSIASGKDTLGLMPTGGGKSLTFQVPTMAMEGVCIVVTPLIALMKDQVDNLKRRSIPAAAIYTGMSSDEILVTLDNCIFEAYKFLYVSPERLATKLFIEKIAQAKVCMIAVDESHCISQWGYDFRPAYLRIVDLRLILPDVPVLALTATATPEVVDDIQVRLGFKEKNVFQKSFHRSNLAYVVRHTENKDEYMLKILNSVPGTSVVYVRNRKKTKEVAEFLIANGIAAEHFHAGLKNETKDERQARWKNDVTRIIVSTNAFGMGIDKPEVRTVIHLDLPDSIEAYFQEAGRAGRDEKKAYAIMLYNNGDAVKMRKRVADSFPPKEFCVKVYEALANYLVVGEGSGLDKIFAFNLMDFCMSFKLPMLMTYSAIKILEQAGYLHLSDEDDSASRVLFIVHKEEMYKQKHQPFEESLIHMLLRSYTGLFTDYAYINEDVIAKRMNTTRENVCEGLIQLSRQKTLKYIPRKKTPYLTYTLERQASERLVISKTAYDDRRDRYINKIKSILDYAKEEEICRNQILLAYFGDKNTQPCGKCDICLKNKELTVTDEEFTAIRQAVLALVDQGDSTFNKVLANMPYKRGKAIKVMRTMLDNEEIIENNLLRLMRK